MNPGEGGNTRASTSSSGRHRPRMDADPLEPVDVIAPPEFPEGSGRKGVTLGQAVSPESLCPLFTPYLHAQVFRMGL